MTKFTKEQLIEIAQENVDTWRLATEYDKHKGFAEPRLYLAEITLAALTAEPVADVVAWSKPGEERTCDIRWRRHDVAPGPLYAAPQRESDNG